MALVHMSEKSYIILLRYSDISDPGLAMNSPEPCLIYVMERNYVLTKYQEGHTIHDWKIQLVSVEQVQIFGEQPSGVVLYFYEFTG